MTRGAYAMEHVKPTILIVEDEGDLRASMAYGFEREGFHTVVTESGVEALSLAKGAAVVILDVLLPDLLGTEVCRQLRADPDTRDVPIIMLSARVGEHDRIAGFQAGADDYVAKPFSVRELVLRARAKMSRGGIQTAPHASAPANYEELVVDREGHSVLVKGVAVRLTALEFRLLTTLMDRAGRVQTRDMLLDDVWGAASDPTGRSVDTAIMRLRSKLGEAGRFIATVRGTGYCFHGDDDE